ncbi:sensor histidine kinase [Cohnella sp. GCM10027633]|uniref:sensor histidine kinase n=1 Tax=unclassified Cohnella TaxID=2636738 RepID=UPI003639FF0B
MTIFPKLILAFLIVLLPLFGLSIRMNEQSKELVRKEITQSIEQRMVSFISTLELDFERAMRLQTEYVNDDDIDVLSTREDLSYVNFTAAVSRLQDRLRLMKNAASFVHDSFVDISLLDRRIATDAYGEIPPGDGAVLYKPTNRLESPFIVHQGKLWITLPYPGTANRQPVFTLGLEISDANLKAFLNEYTDQQDGGSLLAHDGLDWMVGSGETDPSVTAAVKEKLGENANAAIHQRSATIKVDGESYYLFIEKSDKLGLSLSVFVKESKIIGPLKQYKDRVWWLSIASVIIVVLFSYWIYRLIHRPLAQLVYSFRKLERGEMDEAMQLNGKGEFSYLFERFNKTVYRLKELIDEVYVQQYQAKVAELKQLQSQINPHFLFNCFFNLYRIAKMHEIDQVIRVTRSLGEYFRYITRGSDRIRLEEEIKHAKAYADIQEIRFEDQIRVEFEDIPERWRERLIPKLIVQPLLENSYQHGLEDRDEPGFIRVGFLEDERLLTIFVEDNGDLADEQLAKINGLLEKKQSPEENAGLYNVKRRFQLFFGEDGTMKASRSDSGGLRIELQLPAVDKGGE